MAGIVPLYKGDWRNMNALEVQSTGSLDVRVRFPMSRRNASWLREVTSETSPFSMHEHEPGQSLTYARRHWGLVLGKPAATTRGEGGGPLGPFYQARLFYGVVGLDAYKDFVLDWKDSGTRYPRVYLKAADAARYKEQLQASAMPEEFKTKLLGGTIALGANDTLAAAKVKATLGRLAFIAAAPLSRPPPDTTGRRRSTPPPQAPMTCWAGRACRRKRGKTFAPALRSFATCGNTAMSLAMPMALIRAIPSMGVARFSPMVSFLPLVPDHPMFGQWRAHMAAYLDYKATTQMRREAATLSSRRLPYAWLQPGHERAARVAGGGRHRLQTPA